MKNSEVAQAFVYGEEAKTENLFVEKNNGKLVIYSYGYDFPLCVKLKDGTLLFNGENYSQTTAKHKGDVCRALGFINYSEMLGKEPNTILHTSEELKSIIYNDEINSLADYLATKV